MAKLAEVIVYGDEGTYLSNCADTVYIQLENGLLRIDANGIASMCVACEGNGFDDDGENCVVCNGTGLSNKTIAELF